MCSISKQESLLKTKTMNYFSNDLYKVITNIFYNSISKQAIKYYTTKSTMYIIAKNSHYDIVR